MKKSGRPFESLVHEIYSVLCNTHNNELVDKNVFLDGPDGKRQIDVLIRSEVAGMPILTIIECKDHSKRLDITYIDSLVSKMNDVNANKGVLVSRKGFSKNALQKAKRLGITVCIADRARDALARIGEDIPIIGHHVEPSGPVSAHIKFLKGQYHESIMVDVNSLFNDIGLLDILRPALKQNAYDFSTGYINIKSITENDDIWIRDSSGKKIGLEEASISLHIKEIFYFGYISEFETAKHLINISNQQHNIVVPMTEFADYRKKLKQFSSKDDLPKFAQRTSLNIFSTPEKIDIVGEIKLYGKK